MIFELMLVCGVVILGFALRSFRAPSMFRLGSWCILAASFLAGWLLGGSVWLGVGFALSWLLLPWVEILTRLRRLRLPVERKLGPLEPPSREAFPVLRELCQEVEAEGFEHLADIGWQDEFSRQFYRVYQDATSKTQVSICLAEQGDLSFYYLSLTSRMLGGQVFMTWNYPFAYGLKFSPLLDLQRVDGTRPFREFLGLHRTFLRERGIADGCLTGVTPEGLVDAMQREFRSQIRHNLDQGLLRKEDEWTIRYTVRGMFFLWFQFLRDLVRLF